MEMIDMRPYFKAMNDASEFMKSLPRRKEPSAGTIKQYETVYNRLARNRQTPIQAAHTKSSYYAYRAAWLYVCEREAKYYLKAADKAKDKVEKVAYIKAAKKLVDAIRKTPPDFEGKNLKLSDAGKYEGEWKQSKKPVQASRSKKRQVSKLPHDWQERLLNRLHGSKYHAVVACMLLCGARPVELSKGVKVSMDGDGIRFLIDSAKNHDGKYGQGLRSFVVYADNAAFHCLKAFISSGESVVKVSGAKTLCEKMRGFSRDVFPSLKSHVSSYTCRHNFAAEAKAILGADMASICLGHCNDLSRDHYARAKRGGSFRIEHVSGQRALKRVSKNNLDQILDFSPYLSMH